MQPGCRHADLLTSAAKSTGTDPAIAWFPSPLPAGGCCVTSPPLMARLLLPMTTTTRSRGISMYPQAAWTRSITWQAQCRSRVMTSERCRRCRACCARRWCSSLSERLVLDSALDEVFTVRTAGGKGPELALGALRRSLAAHSAAHVPMGDQRRRGKSRGVRIHIPYRAQTWPMEAARVSAASCTACADCAAGETQRVHIEHLAACAGVGLKCAHQHRSTPASYHIRSLRPKERL